jgi:hypothetical protein
MGQPLGLGEQRVWKVDARPHAYTHIMEYAYMLIADPGWGH